MMLMWKLYQETDTNFVYQAYKKKEMSKWL